MVNEKSHKPGDIVKIAGTEFVVLDVQKSAAMDGRDKLFILLKEPAGDTAFSENDSNDFSKSMLREKTDEWFEKFAEGINRVCVYSREIDLTTVDGIANHGVLHLPVAPLTFDEYRKYFRYIPNCGKSYWLATGYGAPGHYGATRALYVYSNGDWNYYYCSDSYAVRPALIVSSFLLDDTESDLSRYTTEELLEEIRNRIGNSI